MIREALEYLSGIAVDAHDPQEIKTGDKHKTTVLLPDGKVVDYLHPPAPRSHTVRDLSDFCAAVKRYSPKDQTIWLSLESAMCVLCDVQDGHRENRVTLVLSPSSVFGALADLGKPLKQEQFIRRLKTAFGCCEWSHDLMTAVQTIRFTKSVDGESTVSGKGDSFGKSVKASVSGMQAPLPDQVECSFAAFPLINHEAVRDTVSVACALFVDHQEAEFTLVPLPYAIDEAKLVAVEAVQKVLSDVTKVPVYIGTP